MKKKLVAAVVLIALAGSWWIWSRPAGEAGPLTLNGNVDIRQVDLAFQVEGRIQSVEVEEGDTVKAGDVVATLEPGYFDDTLAFAKARLAGRQATLDKLEAGSRPEEIARAKAERNETAAELNNAQQRFKRQQNLVDSSAGSRQAFDDAKSALDQAVARKDAAEQTLALTVAGPRAEDIEAARAEVKSEQAGVSLAERRLKDATLVAPAGGTILTRIKEPGAVVGAGTSVLSLAVAKPVWVRAYVSGADLGRIHPGQKAEVYTDGQPDHPYAGQVGFISPTAEFTPKAVQTKDLRTSLVYRFRVVVEKPDEHLRQGMPVSVALTESGTAAN